jgi:GT2 family glycosyltransferase
MRKRIAAFLSRHRDVNIDEHISDNIRKFRATIPDAKIKAYSRDSDWEKKVEIVIPCYNHAQFLKPAFNSILEQSSKRAVTVTFVNDKSSDDSLEIMQEIQRSNKASWVTVRIIDNKNNLNQAGSINRAVASSSNDLFVMLNADDLLTPDCLALIIATYKKNNELALLGGSSLWFEDGEKLPKHIPKSIKSLRLKKYGPRDATNFTELNSINMSQSSCSFFKGAWELVGGYFDRSKRVCSFDDRDFQMRVCSALPIGIYEDYPMEFYRTSSSQGRATI